MKPKQSPWGEVDYCETVNPYVHIVSTSGHGGVMVDELYAKEMSKPAQEKGLMFDAWLCYEEDCDIQIAINELPEVRAVCTINDKEDFEKQLEYWNGDYYSKVGMKF